MNSYTNAASGDAGADDGTEEMNWRARRQKTGNSHKAKSSQDGSKDAKRPRFILIPLKAIEVEDDSVYLIDGLLPVGPAFGLTIGPPKSLKSFLLMYAGICISAALRFAGRDVRQGAVAYVTSEGIRGVKRRLKGIRKDLNLDGKDVPFFLVPVMPNLGTDASDLNVLIAEIEKTLEGCGYKLEMVVIDTVRRATPGKDENSARDMGVYIQNCDALATHFQCLVMSLHHSPRGAKDRGSGTNALDGAMDVAWTITRKDGSRTATATIAWMKDGNGEGISWSFTLRNINIGTEEKPIFTCTIDVTDASEQEAEVEIDVDALTGGGAKAKGDKPAWRKGSLPVLKAALIEVLLREGKLCKPFPDMKSEVKTAISKNVRAEFVKRYPADTAEAKATAWRRSLKDATQTYHLVGTYEVEGVQLLWMA